MKKSLQKRLVQYLQARPHEKVAKGKLEELAKAKMGVIGETVGRRLRILAQVSEHGVTYNEETTPEQLKAKELLGNNKIRVEHRGKNHCFYWFEPNGPVTKRQVIVVDGIAKEIYTTVMQ